MSAPTRTFTPDERAEARALALELAMIGVDVDLRVIANDMAFCGLCDRLDAAAAAGSLRQIRAVLADARAWRARLGLPPIDSQPLDRRVEPAEGGSGLDHSPSTGPEPPLYAAGEPTAAPVPKHSETLFDREI